MFIQLICGDYDLSIYISKNSTKKKKPRIFKVILWSFSLLLEHWDSQVAENIVLTVINELYGQNLCPLKVYELRCQHIMVAGAEHQFIRKLVSDVLQCFDHSYGDMSNFLSNKKKCLLKEWHQDIWHQRFILYLFLEMRRFIWKKIVLCKSL